MEIRPASVAQVVRGRDGRLIEIDNDVQNIAADLHAFDESLHLRYSETGGYFVVYQTLPDGSEQLVLTSVELSPLVVARVKRVAAPDYSLVDEMERLERQAERDKTHALNEKTGEVGERLHHALGKDFGFKPKIYVPRNVD